MILLKASLTTASLLFLLDFGINRKDNKINMTDVELLELLHSDTHDALEQIMDLHTGLIYSIVRNKIYSICSTEDVEECVSDVFFDFYLNIDKIDLAKGSIKNYLCVIAKRRAINKYHQNCRICNSVSFEEETIDPELSDDFCGDDELIKEEERQALTEAINSLGPPDSEIIKRKYYLLESSKCIAERLNMTVNAVDLRIFRAIKKLRQIIKLDT